jgi:hypothetical protein
MCGAQRSDRPVRALFRFEQLYSQMMQLIGNCPEEPYLVHSGYGFGNVLAQDGRITAALDWMDAWAGDRQPVCSAGLSGRENVRDVPDSRY